MAACSRCRKRVRSNVFIEIIALADDLAGDFRRVRDRFEQLNRDLRERLMDNDASRGEVLEALFAGVDVIADQRGRADLLRVLAAAHESRSELGARPGDRRSRVPRFAGQLDIRDRRFRCA